MLKVMDPNYQSPGVPTQPTPPQPTPPYPAPPAPQAPADPYSFIMDTQHKKKSLLPKDGSIKSRLLILASVGIVLIFAIIAISSLLGGGKENNAQLLTNLAAEQTEIIRIADLGIKGSTNPDTLAYLQTTKISVTAEQVKILGYLTLNKVKVTPLQLNAKLNKTIDAELVSATASNQFDEVVVTKIKESLKVYSANLSITYKSAGNPTSQKILSESFNSTSVLLK